MRSKPAVPITETFEGKTVWDGVVHVFQIHGHPKASKAFPTDIGGLLGDFRRQATARAFPARTRLGFLLAM